MFYTPVIERALRLASLAHRGQFRKATDIPYFSHPAAVAVILAGNGFTDEAVIAAALLHDVVEDTDIAWEQLQAEFPASIPEYVAALSETKQAADGTKRPWIDRKREHIAQVAAASLEVRAIALADKLHNLTTMLFDLTAGVDVWKRFNAPREQILWYHRVLADAAGQGDPRLERLAAQCHSLIARLE
ncbi:MAG: bifunctional (p)ppGpp synthetase/guanosine-3',5'-bis(diphosphate) 3'-pyrophosphohydrolase [Planctomycetaceae bacterium]|nr:bifunctional (p)ppGpp synthetase/guanosine-3',5'-bis(diphosphate) 3'-pyrophosphohydrolase [Planctomycetaceae bacterium]